jgi:hypothetical protein
LGARAGKDGEKIGKAYENSDCCTRQARSFPPSSPRARPYFSAAATHPPGDFIDRISSRRD